MVAMITLPCARCQSVTPYIPSATRSAWGRSLVYSPWLTLFYISVLKMAVTDIYIVADKDSNELVLKLHRLVPSLSYNVLD